MENVLVVNHLTQKFKKREQGMNKDFLAVDQVSFTLAEGEILGIVGESGCGKSTLARAIMGFGDQPEGEIMLGGIDMIYGSAPEKKKAYRLAQMVFQDPIGSFNPKKTLGFAIGESLKNQNMSPSDVRKRVEELLAECGLSADFADRYPHEVSGGQAQRAAIARALAVEPKLLICDEATSALDVTIQKQVMELLDQLQKEKQMAVLFICHNLALVQSFCHRVLVMQGGKIVESGTPDAIIHQPQNEYTKNLVEAAMENVK